MTPWRLSGPLSGRIKSHWMQDNSDMVETSSNEGSPTSFVGDVMAPDLFAAIVNDLFFDVFSDYTSNGHQLMNSDETDGQSSDRPVNVNEFVDSHGKTLLHQACRYGRYQVVKCLLFHGADVLTQCKLGRTPFHDAVSSGKREGIVEILGLLYKHEPSGITRVDRNGTHVLHLAAIHGRLDVLKWCSELESGLDASSETTRTVIPMAITSFSGRNVLHYAAYNGRLHVIQWLLSDDNEKKDELSISSLDMNGYSILHYASMGGHLNICQWLVFHASSRNELNIKAKTSGGQTVADLAKLSEIKNFLSQIAQPPPAPCDLRCVGADACSIGISWKINPPLNPLLLEVLAPKWIELEYCKRPTGLARASGIFTMLMTMPSTTAPSIFKWEQVGALIDPRATEYWMCGLEKETEYLVRMRAMNRNGYGAYSLITMSGDFATTNGSSNTFKVSPGVDYHYLDAAFIGTLHFELLEARHLRVSPWKRTTSRKEAADQGRFYSVLSLQTPWISSPSNRRRNQTAAAEDSKCLYRIRSEFARVQEEMVRAGSLHAFRHPCFKLQTILRVPEASQSMLTVEIHHDTLREDSCIGVAKVPLMDFVRGLPAKLRWLPLEYKATSEEDGDEMLGEILIRTLFLADGISEIPHPTQLDVYCSTAEELLENSTDSDGSGSEQSSPTSKSSSLLAFSSPPSSSSSAAVMQFDQMGFRIYDPREKPRIGLSSPVSYLQSRRSYSYFKDHYECMAAQQDRNWLQFHRRWHSLNISHDMADSSGFKTSLSDLLTSSCMAKCGSAICPYEQRGNKRLRRLAWYGIPPSSRPALYMRMSRALRKKYAHPNDYFERILKQAMAFKEQNDVESDVQAPPRSGNKFATARRQIQVDLQRTFAGNQCWINTVDGQLALERVLLAYAVHNESVGYCQSMTFIVGRLLCLFQFHQRDPMASEEQVFWLLATFCEDFFPSYYTHGMSGLQIDGLILEALMRKRLPKVFRHFELLQTPHIGLLLVTQWLLPICCAVFPSETSFRVLDAIVYEGPNVVFAIMIALLRISQTELLAETKDYMQLFRFLKERDMRLYDAALLLEIAFDEHILLESTIDSLRSELLVKSESNEAASKA